MNFVFRRLWEWTRELNGRRGRRGLWLPRTPKEYLRRIRGLQRYTGEIPMPPPVLVWSFFSGFTSFMSILTLGVISKYGPAIRDNHLPFAIAPAGASAVLIFGVPSSPLAQPRNVIVGHMIAALIGVFMHALFKHSPESFHWMPAALAVGISIGLMGLTNCYHPPAGATAFIGGYFGPEIEKVGWWYPLYPVLSVSLIMVGIGLILNNICRVYPVYWFTPTDIERLNRTSLTSEAADEAKATGPETLAPGQAPDIMVSHVNSASTSFDLPDRHSNSSSSSSAASPSRQVNDEAANEAEAEAEWLRTRVRELERQLHHQQKDHLNKIQRLMTSRPDLA
ncbi:hypothetical protein GGF46_004651 [Coemansia sp. RSA 552]|nr:hypothetical protein GGF46_004651 [Coemansia sp. RSA 552]